MASTEVCFLECPKPFQHLWPVEVEKVISDFGQRDGIPTLKATKVLRKIHALKTFSHLVRNLIAKYSDDLLSKCL